jgi:hypothetical protein
MAWRLGVTLRGALPGGPEEAQSAPQDSRCGQRPDDQARTPRGEQREAEHAGPDGGGELALVGLGGGAVGEAPQGLAPQP